MKFFIIQKSQGEPSDVLNTWRPFENPGRNVFFTIYMPKGSPSLGMRHDMIVALYRKGWIALLRTLHVDTYLRVQKSELEGLTGWITEQ